MLHTGYSLGVVISLNTMRLEESEEGPFLLREIFSAAIECNTPHKRMRRREGESDLVLQSDRSKELLIQPKPAKLTQREKVRDLYDPVVLGALGIGNQRVLMEVMFKDRRMPFDLRSGRIEAVSIGGLEQADLVV